MLLKSFIDEESLNELKTWIATLTNGPHTPTGKNGCVWKLDELDNVPKCVNGIRNKCLDVIKQLYARPIYVEPFNKDLILRLHKGGFAGVHTDISEYSGYFIVKCNILINKPQKGGDMLHKNTRTIMQERDMYVVDASYIHGITTIEGSDYESLVFGFLLPY